jgi:hypothetical protein
MVYYGSTRMFRCRPNLEDESLLTRPCRIDIKRIFDPVVTDILKLTLQQRNETMKKKLRKPAGVLLMGGLGGNKFLYEKFIAELAASGIDVLQPSGPNVYVASRRSLNSLTEQSRWASICRGAVIKSLGHDDFDDDRSFPEVTSYISTAHYGMAFKEPYDSSKHTDQDRKEYDVAMNMDLVWDQMTWYVKKVSVGP